MPELPDVEVFRRFFEKKGKDKTIEAVGVRSEAVLGNVEPAELENALRDQRFTSSVRHGKHLLIETSGSNWLAVHFGMTGFFDYTESSAVEEGHPRVIFFFRDGSGLIYDCQRKLGEINLVQNPDSWVEEKGLGPDALSGFDRETFGTVFSGSRAMVKSTFMDQGKIAGVGNVYSDEILYQAGIHPRVKASDLTERRIDDLYEKTRVVLKEAIDNEVDPEKLPEYYLLTHRSPGSTCPRCGGEIEKVKVSGRSAYFCPNCQPARE